MAQAINEGKPANIAEKMVNGRIAKYYKDNCLLDQAFVKDGDITVAQYTDKVAKELGGSIKVVNFVRYEKGEGLEKREDNFPMKSNMIGSQPNTCLKRRPGRLFPRSSASSLYTPSGFM